MYFVVLFCLFCFLLVFRRWLYRKYVIVDSKEVLSWRHKIVQTRGLFLESSSNYRSRKLFVCSANIQNRGFNSFEYNVVKLKFLILSFWPLKLQKRLRNWLQEMNFIQQTSRAWLRNERCIIIDCDSHVRSHLEKSLTSQPFFQKTNFVHV